MKAESRAEYDEQCCRFAEEAFAKHAIRETRDNGSRYLLCDKYPDGGWDTTMCCEVIVIRGGLFVGGDSPDCIFRWFSDSDPKRTIGWMGGHQKADSYVFEKACIGIGQELAQTIDPLVALYDLQREIDSYEKDNEEAMPGDLRTAIERAMMEIRGGDQPELALTELHEADEYFDSELVSRIGRVATPRVYYAHAAVRRLWKLICAEG